MKVLRWDIRPDAADRSGSRTWAIIDSPGTKASKRPVATAQPAAVRKAKPYCYNATMYLITGATGLLGSHLAEQLVRQGLPVRALVRRGSDTRCLEALGVELCPGDLSDAGSLCAALHQVDVAFHAAARVGDWGPWRDFQRHTIEGTRNVVQACLAGSIRRLVHLSSISVYGCPPPKPNGITEDEPLATRFWWWDYYKRAKVAAELLVWHAHQSQGLPVTVIRPGWVYGPRDRSRIFRLAAALGGGWMPLIGSGNNLLNLTYAGNVAEACLLAARQERANGQAYNLSHDGPISQREFLQLLARHLNLPAPRWRLPGAVAFHGSFLMEAIGRTLLIPQPPPLTRYSTWYLARFPRCSTAKAERELGWRPRVGYDEGVRQTVEWYGREMARHGRKEFLS